MRLDEIRSGNALQVVMLCKTTNEMMHDDNKDSHVLACPKNDMLQICMSLTACWSRHKHRPDLTELQLNIMDTDFES